MSQKIRVLILEDHASDAELVLLQLRRSGFDPDCQRVQTEADFLAKLELGPDIILTDYAMPHFSGLGALRALKQSGVEIPLIIVSGTIGEEQAVEAMKLGATDYLLKDRLARLGSAVERALEHKRLLEERRRMQEQLTLQATALNAAANAVLITDLAGTILWVNPAFTTLTGYSAEEAIGKNPRFLKSGRHDQTFYQNFWNTILSGKTWHGEFVNRRKNGSLYSDEQTVTPIRSADGAIKLFLGVMHDVTARKQAEEALRLAHEKLRHLLEHSPAVIYKLRFDGARIVPLVVSENIERMLGVNATETVRYEWWLESLHPEDRDRVVADTAAGFARGGYTMEYRVRHKNGTYRWINDSNRVIFDASGQPKEAVGVWADITERKQAEEALRKSEAFNRSLVEHIPQRIFIKDRNSVYLSCNAHYAHNLGIDPEQIVGKDDFAFHPRELAEGYRADDREVISSGRTKDIEERYQLAGEERWVHTIKVPYCDEQGRIIGVLGIFEDITERRRAKEELKLFRALIDHTTVAVEVIDPDTGRYLDVNKQACLDHGYSREELLALSIPDVDPNVDRSLFAQNIERLRKTGSLFLEGVHRRKDGTTYPVEINCTLVRLNREYLVAVVRDITERKKAEEALQRNEKFLRTVLESLPVGVWFMDANGQVQLDNPADQAIWRGTRELKAEQISEYKIWWQSLLGRVREEHWAVTRAMAGGETAVDELKNVLSFNGRRRFISHSAVPVLGAHREILGVIAVNQDVTERQDLEAQLRQAQKMEAIGQLAGGVAHDFNNLLMVIRGNMDLLMTEPEKFDEETVHALKEVIGASERASNLNRQLLAFSRKQVMRTQTLSLNEVAGNLGKMLRRIIGEDIRFQCRCAEDLPLIQADAGLLEQVLMNLVVNARDAMPNGGQLLIRTEAAKIDEAHARTHAEARAGDFVCLSVRDTGTGIAPELMERIFEPFFTTKEVGKGTGLGLATVYGIVKQHQGWIEVASELGKGTAFKIFLPVAAPVAGRAGPAPAELQVRGGSETILLVEDEETVRLLTRRVLEHYGYRVLEAESGVAALAVWRTRGQDIDLLLTDLVMPDGLTGRELAAKLRAQRSELKVIYTSGYSEDVAGKDLAQQKGNYFLQKPYPPRTLAQTVRGCLDGREP